MATPRIGIGGVSVNKAGIARLQKQNDVFVANLSNSLKGLGKDVLGALASEALMGVIDNTPQDSSRAAANWNLSISGKGLSSSLSPRDYGQSGASWGTIGSKGSRRAFSSSLNDYKKMYYGIGTQEGGEFLQPKKGGKLYSELNIGKEGNYKVELFNPILGGANPRRDGWTHTGNTYAYNAFGGATIFSGKLKGLEGLEDEIGNGFVPWYIRKLDQEIQVASAAGRIIKQ